MWEFSVSIMKRKEEKNREERGITVKMGKSIVFIWPSTAIIVGHREEWAAIFRESGSFSHHIIGDPRPPDFKDFFFSFKAMYLYIDVFWGRIILETAYFTTRRSTYEHIVVK